MNVKTSLIFLFVLLFFCALLAFYVSQSPKTKVDDPTIAQVTSNSLSIKTSNSVSISSIIPGNTPKVDAPNSSVKSEIKIPTITENKPVVINDTFVPAPNAVNPANKTIVSNIKLTSPVSGPGENWFTLKDSEGDQYTFKQIPGAETSKFYSNGIDSDVIFTGEVEEVVIDKAQFPDIKYKAFTVKSATLFNKI
jgi:hypothetical protein